MHFVIGVFVALICLVTVVLFTEVFPKWLKAFLTLLGSASCGYAISIFIRKVSIWTNAFAKPAFIPLAGICAVIVLVLCIIVTMMLKKKKAK